MAPILTWLEHAEGPLAYLVLALAAGLEYVLPPLPGDTITLFGIFLAFGAGYHTVLVYLALDAGALAGSLAAYGVGRLLARPRRRPPRFLRSQQARKAIDVLLTRFERHGAMYLAINRFVPGLRAFCFVAAGMARLTWWKVAGWGLVSASVYNALLLGLGWLVGGNFTELRAWVERYTYAAAGVLVAVVMYFAIRTWLRRRRARSEPEALQPSDAREP